MRAIWCALKSATLYTMGLLWIFIFSLWGIAVLFTVRLYELRRDIVFFAHARARLDTAVIRLFLYVRHATDGTIKNSLKRVATYISHGVVFGVLLLVRALERRLSRVVLFIKGKYIPKRGEGKTSKFLEEVGRGRVVEGKNAE